VKSGSVNIKNAKIGRFGKFFSGILDKKIDKLQSLVFIACPKIY